MDEESVVQALEGLGVPYDTITCRTTFDRRDPRTIVSDEFDGSIEGQRMEGSISQVRRIGLIVNDGTRPTPTHLVLEHLMFRFPGLEEKISVVVIATGSHKAPQDRDLRTILGLTYPRLIGKVHVHDSNDEKAHIYIGRTSRGTACSFDRAMDGCDLLLLINSVEPHYFAGFTGGRKSIMPGIAAYNSIQENHKLAMEEGSKVTVLDGNPVHEDMMEACGKYMEGREHISMQMVQAPGRTITDMMIGDLGGSFSRAVKASRERFCPEVERKYDIVVTLARPPMDRSLYQAQKAIENSRSALRNGGTMVLVAECNEGIGQSTFWDVLSSSKDPMEVMARIDAGYRLGYHKAARIVQLAETSDIYLVGRIPRETLAKGFIRGFPDIGSALTSAIGKTGRSPSILFVPDGTVTVPIPKGGMR